MKETVQVTREDQRALDAVHNLITLCHLKFGNTDPSATIAMEEGAWLLARLSATSAPAGVEGWKLVPVEPTEAMIDAGDDCYGVARGTESWVIGGCKGSEKIWREMIAAAPAPSGQEVAGDVRRLVIAARNVAFGDEDAGARAELDAASEAFASRVAWDDAPTASGVTVPEGMKAWNGGESAPEDWDGGPVKLRCGDMEPASLIEEADWQIGYPENGFKPSQVDIVAYTPKPAALSTPSATPGEVERLVIWGGVNERDRMHGGGYYVRWSGHDYKSPTFSDRDAAYAELARLRAAAIIAALSPQGLDAKEGRCGKCRGSGHVQRGDSGECDACGGTGDDTSEAPSQGLDAATVERCAQVCEEQERAFLSPEYATGQPLSSFSERFAAGKCAEEIRALIVEKDAL